MVNTSIRALALAALTFLAAPTAAATIHPGAGYTVDRGDFYGTCSLAHVAEFEGAVYGLTAGHCANYVGERVRMEDAPHEEGTFISVTDPRGSDHYRDLEDYAIIKFDPGTAYTSVARGTYKPDTGIAPVNRALDTFPIRSAPVRLSGTVRDLDAEPVAPGELMFKVGRTTGWTPVVVDSQSSNDIRGRSWVQPGDSGGALYDRQGRIVGITSRVGDGLNAVWHRADVALRAQML